MKQKKHPQPAAKPVWTISNGLSFFRLLLAIPFALLFMNPHGNQAYILILCVIAYITDLGDGYIARLRKEQSDLGRILDPLADKVVVITIVVGMLLTRMLPVWFVVVILIRDVIIFFAGIYLKKRTGILVESNFAGKAAVFSIMITIVVALFQRDISGPALQIMILISLGLMAASMYMYGERFFRLLSKKTSK